MPLIAVSHKYTRTTRRRAVASFRQTGAESATVIAGVRNQIEDRREPVLILRD